MSRRRRSAPRNWSGMQGPHDPKCSPSVTSGREHKRAHRHRSGVPGAPQPRCSACPFWTALDRHDGDTERTVFTPVLAIVETSTLSALPTDFPTHPPPRSSTWTRSQATFSLTASASPRCSTSGLRVWPATGDSTRLHRRSISPIPTSRPRRPRTMWTSPWRGCARRGLPSGWSLAVGGSPRTGHSKLTTRRSSLGAAMFFSARSQLSERPAGLVHG